VDKEYKALIEIIKDLLDILAKEPRVMAIIKMNLLAHQGKSTPRRARPRSWADEGENRHRRFDRERRRHHHAYAQRSHQAHERQPVSRAASRRQGRHRHDDKDGETAEDNDFVEHLFTASTHDYLMFFTNTGRVYVERVHEIPDMGRAAKGRSIANLLRIESRTKKSPRSSAFFQDGRKTRKT